MDGKRSQFLFKRSGFLVARSGECSCGGSERFCARFDRARRILDAPIRFRQIQNSRLFDVATTVGKASAWNAGGLILCNFERHRRFVLQW